MRIEDDAELMYGTDRVKNSPKIDTEERKKLEEWAARLRMSVPDLELFCRNGFHFDRIPPHDGPARRNLLAHLKKTAVPVSKWLLISGLYPELLYSEVERRKRLRALYRALVLLIRRALARYAADPYKSERTLYWDPIAEVCRDLEIAPSKLSAFCKEFCGNSLSQVVDCVRAERIQKMMREQLRAFIRERTTHGAVLAAKSEDKVDVWSVWAELKKSRKWPEFSQNTWAIGFGFSTYCRMYRACLAVYGMAPHQMEVMVIREILSEGETTDCSPKDLVNENTLEEIEVMVKEIQVYRDESMVETTG